MLCERILFNLDQRPSDDSAPNRALDVVDLHWSELGRRALRKVSRSGCDVRILLPLGVRLLHGDVIGEEAGRLFAVEVLPCDVWIVRTELPSTLASVSLELGNLHIPAQVTADGELIVCPDGPAAGIFNRYGLTWKTEQRGFAPLRCEGLIVKAAENFSIRKVKAPAPPSAYEKAGI